MQGSFAAKAAAQDDNAFSVTRVSKPLTSVPQSAYRYVSALSS